MDPEIKPNPLDGMELTAGNREEWRNAFMTYIFHISQDVLYSDWNLRPVGDYTIGLVLNAEINGKRLSIPVPVGTTCKALGAKLFLIYS